MTASYCVVYCTCPNYQVAESMALRLTESRLVACTNIVPHLTSLYMWQGKVTNGAESLLMMKTTQEKLPELEKAILETHPYEFPEIIAMPIIYGNKAYLAWVDEVVGEGT